MDSLQNGQQKGDIANKLGDMKFSDFPKRGAHGIEVHEPNEISSV
ncbi:MAG: hypothetical protein CM15mP73_0920 [Hyphomicrobiales bacterium]|nr:MAG: hypothetical protein CM15mP73_0920 [Hyphomicrobiales bacterium]